MSSQSDLVPHIAHGIRASNLRPVVEEILHLNLLILVSCGALTLTCITKIHLSNDFEGGRKS